MNELIKKNCICFNFKKKKYNLLLNKESKRENSRMSLNSTMCSFHSTKSGSKVSETKFFNLERSSNQKEKYIFPKELLRKDETVLEKFVSLKINRFLFFFLSRQKSA